MSEYEFSNSSGVVFSLEQDKDSKTEEIVIRIPTYLLKSPRKPYQEKLVGEDVNGIGEYEVPKSESFVYDTKALKSGHRIALQITRKVSDEVREKVYQAALAKGLRVKSLEIEQKTTPTAQLRKKTRENLVVSTL